MIATGFFKKIPFALSWIVLTGLIFFLFYLITRENTGFFIGGPHPGLISIILMLAVLVSLYFLFRNIELIILAFLSILLPFIITAGIASFFDIGRNVSVLWIMIYLFNLITGASVLYTLHRKGKRIRWSSTLSYHIVCLALLVVGFILLALMEQRTGKIIGFACTGTISTVLYASYFQRVTYEKFFTRRIGRGMQPLTLLRIIQTLWTYFILVLGSALIGVFGVLVYALWFTDIEWRKRIIHYMVMYYSRFFIWVIPISPKYINETGEQFKKPAVIISNHQSLIDTALLFRLCPKAIILTNDWVYNSPVFGHISKLADFYNVSAGIDRIFEKLRERVEEGYSILVFPEGTRSLNQKIQRFHRGAFYIAEKLEMDIVPILFYGTGEFLKKGEFWGKSHPVCQKVFSRITIKDRSYGENYSKRAKYIRQYLTMEYQELKGVC